MYVFDLVIDYVQVVDMGTLELRITAAKPGADGKLVKKKRKKSHLRIHPKREVRKIKLKI